MYNTPTSLIFSMYYTLVPMSAHGNECMVHGSTAMATCCIPTCISSLLGIKVVPIVKRRGRPRGHDLTAIGLPAKKAKKKADKKPCTFSRLHTSRKEEGTLYFQLMLFICLHCDLAPCNEVYRVHYIFNAPSYVSFPYSSPSNEMKSVLSAFL